MASFSYRLHRFVIASAAMLSFVAGIASAQADMLTIGLSSDVTSIDPHWNNSGPNVSLATHIFEPLTLTDRNGRLIPGLATSWRAIDPLTWEFKLRPGVKFHDGSDFTADDVVFSIERPKTLQGSPASFASFVRPIVEVVAVDKATVRVKTSVPHVLVPYDLNSIFIVSKKATTAAGTNADFDSGRAAIGTGPYKLVSFKRGDRVELTRNDAYWGSKPAWDKATFRMLSNDAARIAALLSGDVDAIENVPTADVAKLAADARFKIDKQTSWRTIFWHMDQYRDVTPFATDKSGKPLTKNPFKDARVRLAVSKAINRDAIVSRVMEGLAVPASNLVSPGIFGHNPAIPVEAYDPAGAKKLLAEASYPDGFMLTIHAPNNRYVNDARIAETVAALLSRIGITTRVQTQPWASYLPHARAGEYTMALVGWGSSLGDNTIKNHLGTPDEKTGYGAWNFGRYSNLEVDRQLEHDFTLFDDKAREEAAKTVAALALKDHPVIPMHHEIVSWAMKKGLSYPGRVDQFTFAFQFTRQ
ncbi:MAG: ABC transporter substrate-binding protein [Burkholderiaceae bacterium]